MVFITLLLAAVALAGDVLSTVKSLGSGAQETNPVMRWLMTKIGMWPALLSTHVLLVVVLGVAGIWWLNLGVAAVFAAITFHNYGQVRK